MQTYCSQLFNHSQVLWPRDHEGDGHCPFENPILTPTFDERPPPEPGNPLPEPPDEVDNSLPEPPPVIDNELPEPESQPKAVAADGSPIYWDHGPLIITSFDDFERVAQEYSRFGDPLEARAYDDAENFRADAIKNDRAVKQAQADLDRAIALNAAPAELQALQEATLASEGIEEGDPWRQPTGAHDAYPLDALVSHVGKQWRSTVAANVWEPGVSGWVEEGEGIPDWVQPTGAHDAYPLGAVVRHVGLVWESLVDANVWEPGAVGSETLWGEIPDPEA